MDDQRRLRNDRALSGREFWWGLAPIVVPAAFVLVLAILPEASIVRRWFRGWPLVCSIAVIFIATEWWARKQLTKLENSTRNVSDD